MLSGTRQSESDLQDMRIASSAETTKAYELEVFTRDGLKNVLICILAIFVVLLSGVVYGFATGGPYQSNDLVSQLGSKASVPTNFPTILPEDKRGEGDGPMRLDNFMTEAKRVESLIENYYGAVTFKSILMNGLSLYPGTKEYHQNLEYNSRNIIRALIKKTNYTIGVIGSSVAAGHDNCNYDSYERQLQRTLSPVWRAYGVDIEVRNAGEGGSCGDTHRNQIYCVQQNAGGDSDVIHYSWTYFEGPSRGHLEHEMVLRWSLMMEKAPSVHIFNAGGKKKQGCLYDARNYKLLKTYGGKYGFNALCLEGALYGNKKYTGKSWGAVGDGLHTTTRYGKNESAVRKKSLGVVWRNWHPGPLGFQLVSDLFAWYHIQSIKLATRAISERQKELKRNVRLSDFGYFTKPLMASDLPSPLFCDSKLCTVEQPPGCLNLEEPTYGHHQVSIVPSDDDLSIYRGQILDPSKGGWEIKKTRPSGHLIPKSEINYGKCSHLDACGYVQASTSSAKWLVFKLPKMSNGIVALCGCCGKKPAENMFIKNPDLEIQFDGQTLDPATFKIWPEQKCVRVLEKFPAELKDPGGHLYLGLRIKVAKSKNVAISHVIAM